MTNTDGGGAVPVSTASTSTVLLEDESSPIGMSWFPGVPVIHDTPDIPDWLPDPDDLYPPSMDVHNPSLVRPPFRARSVPMVETGSAVRFAKSGAESAISGNLSLARPPADPDLAEGAPDLPAVDLKPPPITREEGPSIVSLLGLGGSRRLRMFHVAERQLTDAGLTVAPEYAESGVLSRSMREFHIAYIESDSSGNFNLTSPATLWYTLVPSVKLAYGWRLQTISYSPLCVERDTDVDLIVLYKDPFVLRVPDEQGGGWLMLLARVRFRISFVIEQDEYKNSREPDEDKKLIEAARKLEPSCAGTSIGDIVAYWSREQTFREEIKGPFLVVDSLTAFLPTGAGDYAFRTWLGAPTGIFCGEGEESKFYVYFNANRALVYTGTPSTANSIFDSDDSSVAGLLEGLYDSATFPGGAVLRSGVGVKAIALEDVRRAVSYGDEASNRQDPWEYQDAWPGTISEPVRRFIETGSVGSGVYEDMDAAVADAIHDSYIADPAGGARLVDASAVHTHSSDPGTILVHDEPFYFVTVTRSDPREDGSGTTNSELSANADTMLGMWRFRFLETASTASGVTGGALFGRDFAAAFGTGTTRSSDQITASQLDLTISVTNAYGEALDADPVAVPLATLTAVRVFSRLYNLEVVTDDFVSFMAITG